MKKMILMSGIIILTCFTVSAATLGDANNDQNVTIVDALLVAQYYVGIRDTVTAINVENSDVNADAAVTIVDALLIAQYYVGAIDRFPGDTDPDGPLVSISSCKTDFSQESLSSSLSFSSFLADENIEDPGDDYQCLKYHYDPEQKILYLSFINEVLNCCGGPVLDRFSQSASSMSFKIVETSDMLCACLCLYDMDFKVKDIESGPYSILFNSPYSNNNFYQLDLNQQPDGSICVFHDDYPYGLYE